MSHADEMSGIKRGNKSEGLGLEAVSLACRMERVFPDTMSSVSSVLRLCSRPWTVDQGLRVSVNFQEEGFMQSNTYHKQKKASGTRETK